MAQKRKRATKVDNAPPSKRGKIHATSDIHSLVATSLLPCYYPHVDTLRSFVTSRYPNKSDQLQRRLDKHPADSLLACLLDTTLVGSFTGPTPDDSAKRSIERERTQRAKDFFEFTQRSSGSSNRRISDGTTIASSLGEGSVGMPDLVEFAVWRLFHRIFPLLHRPPHVLCHGQQRSDVPKSTAEDRAAMGGIEGLTRLRLNAQFERLKDDDWCLLLRELGMHGDQVILELLLDCGVFVPIEAENRDNSATSDNYWQIAGFSLAELPLLNDSKTSNQPHALSNVGVRKSRLPSATIRTPAAISFVRSRMFYARAVLNGKGRVRFGLRHIHVVNRFPDPRNEAHAKQILKYMFPRQFNLHNVFISTVDRRETAYTFKDYTLREQEIAAAARTRGPLFLTKVPKRLRGCIALVQSMQRFHQNCAYRELLMHYCPVQDLDGYRRTATSKQKKRKRVIDAFPNSTAGIAQANALLTKSSDITTHKHLTELSTSAVSVSAFVRAVIWQVIPRTFFGAGASGVANFQQLLHSVHQFVVCQRFENLTLESVGRNIKLTAIDWLKPASVDHQAKMSMSDSTKRQELLYEFLYYIFDSFVVPLIRSNFHVTESNDHKYRLFYFRHDVWRLITQPALSQIKLNMYQEIPAVKAQDLLSKRALGFSQVRLLPKKATVRPITNLRRREMVRKYGKTYLGASINSTLKNVFSMLNYEKDHRPALLQSSIFSVNELHPRLVKLQSRLQGKGLAGRPLYFVKVDVQSCFDTIPQQAVMNLIEYICHGNQYTVKHHAEIKVGAAKNGNKLPNNPAKKFLAPAHASASSQDRTFSDLVEEQYATGRHNTVFVEGAVQSCIDTEAMLDLLDDHVKRNIVRIGKKHFRQKNGIPQGSILSTLLCSFFYGDFEARKLGFLRKPASPDRAFETMLIRLIDDFLLISTERSHAERFLCTMLAGDAGYGITVKPEKTLTNFKPSTHSLATTNTNIGRPFPWCNVHINTRSLSITRDRNKTIPHLACLTTSSQRLHKLRNDAPDLANSTTIEMHKRAGVAFNRKILAALRLNVRPMYTDLALASPHKVKRELFSGLLEVAERAGRYLVKLKELNGGLGLRGRLVQQTIHDVACVTNALLRKSQRSRFVKRIGKVEVDFLVTKAFLSVLSLQQSRHQGTLRWLGDWQKRLQSESRLSNIRLVAPRIAP